MIIQKKINIKIIKQTNIIYFQIKINFKTNIKNILLNKTSKMNLFNYSQFKENVQLKNKLIIFSILKLKWVPIFSLVTIKLWKVIFKKTIIIHKNIIQKGKYPIYIQNQKNKKLKLILQINTLAEEH